MRIILYLTLTFIVAFCAGWLHCSAQHSCPLLDQYEVQQMLNKLEPDNPIEEDGVIGGKSRKKWDRIKFNEYALRYI